MKYCPYCDIKIGGDLTKCPFCQSRLSGKAEEPYFPTQGALKITSIFYKIQLFIVSTVIIVSIGLDFLFHLNSTGFGRGIAHHWSLIVCMWLIVFEFGLLRLYKGKNSSRILTLNVFIVLIMLMITAYFTGFLTIASEWIVPIVLMGTMIANFVLAMLDKSGNAMGYLLSNLLAGVLPYLVLNIFKHDCPPLWIVCLIVSVVVFAGAVIFKGRSVISEIQKRLNL